MTRFRTLLSASVVSNLGDGMLLGALPLLTAQVTRDPVAVSSVTAFTWLPWLVFSLPVGVLVDRVDRRRLMVVMDGVRVIVVGALAVAVTADAANLPLLFGFAFAMGIAETMFDNGAQTILPSVVTAADLPRANGRLFAAEVTANQFIGPPLGSALFVVAAAAPFAVDAASFALSGVLLASIPGHYRTVGRVRAPMRTEIAEGVRWLWNHRVIRSFAIGAATLNVTFTAGMSLLVLFAQTELDIGDAGFGVLLAGMAVGSTAGSLVASKVVARLGSRAAVVAAVATIGGSLLGVAFTCNAVMAGALLAITGFAQMVWNVVAVSYRQAVVPDELLGRINSVYRLLAYGSFPIGALVGGMLAANAGLGAPWLFAGIGTLLLVPWLLKALR
ncbi:MAG: MFS transporter, partial [Acidimicrobiia bacterium]|nr:MFS transporter [Acidimicrobiia bacterium]